MAVDINNAISAYNAASRPAATMGLGLQDKTDAPEDFAGLVKGAVQTSIDTMKNGERMSMKAIAGQADLTEVVTAVSAAEVTLQTVMAVRDKVITAYNEIMRMPI
ncbi:MAG: flagellar hook-basal body complex protein FliE [Alphaproteobacteria bacterium]|nr:flagellar hook-basal body complex protein FliE [Alphaproteobacteria bacterium]